MNESYQSLWREIYKKFLLQKNDIEDSADTSGEVDTDLSFNNANKFEKEKVPEEQMTNFMKDISLIAVSFVFHFYCADDRSRLVDFLSTKSMEV